jgi:GMP synthase (glutamine-hydrolysing)
MHDRILILDFGSQVTQLIARRVREANVYCEIHPADVSDAFVREFAPKGVILSGSHGMSAYEDASIGRRRGVRARGAGAGHLLRHADDGAAARRQGRVAAPPRVRLRARCARGHTRLLDGIEDARNAEGHGLLDVWMSHGDKVTELPPGFKLMASTESCPIAGMADEARGFYGVQFHPEVTHTLQGRAILRRFVLDICGCRADWTMADFVDEAVARIRAGRRRGGDPRPVGRRRLVGRRRADPPRDRRPADLCVRRPPACCG